ncbi:protein retinal degeneration B-like [Macrobrachium nipponense]|uniref:protein retinal degeneration B-like n=1 Tax=Macrobrachium nipponense TaxID=159736 RepID=UPI0030C7DB65
MADEKDLPVFSPTQPREKWIKKRTSVKIKNVAANHRGNDVIVREGAPQCLQARFMYGPLDMVALSGEKVDIHIMSDPPGGDWQQISTEVTDKNGRITFTIPPERSLLCGMYPVKMVVRGDHTSATLYLTVVPPKTECVVFSIDGSFTASVSVTGRDPKVRAGAVDVEAIMEPKKVASASPSVKMARYTEFKKELLAKCWRMSCADDRKKMPTSVAVSEFKASRGWFEKYRK